MTCGVSSSSTSKSCTLESGLDQPTGLWTNPTASWSWRSPLHNSKEINSCFCELFFLLNHFSVLEKQRWPPHITNRLILELSTNKYICCSDRLTTSVSTTTIHFSQLLAVSWNPALLVLVMSWNCAILVWVQSRLPLPLRLVTNKSTFSPAITDCNLALSVIRTCNFLSVGITARWNSAPMIPVGNHSNEKSPIL